MWRLDTDEVIHLHLTKPFPNLGYRYQAQTSHSSTAFCVPVKPHCFPASKGSIHDNDFFLW